MPYLAELQITHKCRWASCTNWGCDLCRQSAERCFHDLHPSQVLRGTKENDRNAIASSKLRSDCKQPFSVVVAEPSVHTATTTGKLEDCIPTHIQMSLLDSKDGQSLSELASKGADIEDLINSRILNLPELLKAELSESQTATYNDNQLIIPFLPANEDQTGLWVMSDPLHIYSEFSLPAILNKTGSPAKTVSLVIKGLRQDASGQLLSLESLQPFISSPFTFYTRRRDDKNMIPKTSSKIEDLQGMGGATAKKLRNLQSILPEKRIINSEAIPVKPITTAGQLFRFIEHMSDDALEEIGNKMLGRSKLFLANIRETLKERMITMEDDTRPRLWRHPSTDVGLLFAARRGNVVGPEEAMPAAIRLSTGNSFHLWPQELLTLSRMAMKEYSDPYHGQTWSLVTHTEVASTGRADPMAVDKQPVSTRTSETKRLKSSQEAQAGRQIPSVSLPDQFTPAEQNLYAQSVLQANPNPLSLACPTLPAWTSALSQSEFCQQRSSRPVTPSQCSPELDPAKTSLPAVGRSLDILMADQLHSQPHRHLREERRSQHPSDWLISSREERGSSKRKQPGGQSRFSLDKAEPSEPVGKEPNSAGQHVRAARVVSAHRPNVLTGMQAKPETAKHLQQSTTEQLGASRVRSTSVEMSEGHHAGKKTALPDVTHTPSLPETPSGEILQFLNTSIPELPHLPSEICSSELFQNLFESNLKPLPSSPCALTQLSADCQEMLGQFDSDIFLPSLRTLGLIDPGCQADQKSTSFMEAIAALEDPDMSKLSSHACAILERWQAHCRQLGLESAPQNSAATSLRVARSDSRFKTGMCGPPPVASSDAPVRGHSAPLEAQERPAVLLSCNRLPETPVHFEKESRAAHLHSPEGGRSTSLNHPSKQQGRPLVGSDAGAALGSHQYPCSNKMLTQHHLERAPQTPVVQYMLQDMSINDQCKNFVP